MKKTQLTDRGVEDLLRVIRKEMGRLEKKLIQATRYLPNIGFIALETRYDNSKLEGEVSIKVLRDNEDNILYKRNLLEEAKCG